jgi:hypothetical protein
MNVGKGTYGIVKKAIHIPTQTTVAIKEFTLNVKYNSFLILLFSLHKAFTIPHLEKSTY